MAKYKIRELKIEVRPTYGVFTVFVDGRPVGRYFKESDAEKLADDYRNGRTVLSYSRQPEGDVVS